MNKFCTICNRELNPDANQNKYCSRKCTSQGFRLTFKGQRRSRTTGFKKGLTPWSASQKGVHLSLKSEFKAGMIPWNKGLKGYRAGALNNKWRGGITPLNHKLRTAEEMKEWRKAVFKRDNYTCRHCGEVGGKLNADHIKPFSQYPELRTVLENGRTLCVPCHKNTPTYVGKVLNQFQVARIRLMKQITPSFLNREIAEFFPISRRVISSILQGKSWKWVT